MKPSTRMHEVYDTTFRIIRFCGSQSACVRYVSNRPSQTLQVRVAGR